MAGLIPQDFIDDLIARADIVEVVGSRVQLKKAGREYKACCPFHDEKDAVFHGEPERRASTIASAAAPTARPIGFLMEYEHMSFVEAIESPCRARWALDVPRERKRPPCPPLRRVVLVDGSSVEKPLEDLSARQSMQPPSSTSRNAASTARRRNASASATRRTAGATFSTSSASRAKRSNGCWPRD